MVGVAVGDARSSGTLARSVTRQQRAVIRSESAYVLHRLINGLSVFGVVGDTRPAIAIGSLLVDDTHA